MTRVYNGVYNRGGAGKAAGESGGKGPEKNVRDVLEGKEALSNQISALHFLDCMCRHKDPLELLFRLSDASNGASARQILKRALALASDEAHLESHTLRFLEMLGRDELSTGSVKSCVEDCYRIAYETPGLMRVVLTLLQRGHVRDLDTVAWFIVTLARSHSPARDDKTVRDIAEILQDRADSEAVRCMMNLLLPSPVPQRFDASQITSLGELRALKPQHDNDFPFDYRKIQILPTPDEIKSGMTANGTSSFAPPSLLQENSEVAILDRQFRLLREDMLEPMREEIANLVESKRNNVKNNKVSLNRTFVNPQLIDLAMEPRPCILIRVKMPLPLEKRLKNMKKKEKIAFMDGVGKRILGRDSMLVFIDNEDVVCVGLVVRREKEELVSEDGNLIVGVMFNDDHLKRMLMMMEKRKGKNGERVGSRIGTAMLQTSSSYFSYEPVLQRLQRMDHIPFKEELVEQKHPLASDTPDTPFYIPTSIANKVQSDPGQLLSVERALQDRMVCIQGPPGTGKTFVGVQIARALLRRNPTDRILCLCYTNHALDDFLTSLHEDGMKISDMVRLGSSPKIADHLKSRCISSLTEATFSRNQNMRFAKLKGEQKELMDEMKKLSNQLERRVWGPSWWRTASSFLEENYPEIFTQFLIVSEMNGMRAVGRKGKGVDDDYLWREWLAGRPRPNALTQLPGGQCSIWELELQERRKRLAKWQSEWIQPTIERLVGAMTDYQRTTIELDMLRLESKVPVASEAKVIGATTTSAAKSMRLLDQIRPTIVIVEEAAEILEASVLTSINRSVKKLIMIGDHKQLRPKLECYSLRKESGKGIDFDVSLFERLALQGSFPVLSLTVQHRMRPEISALVRSTTYPSLKDHDTVMRRESIRGVAGGSNVIFLNHDRTESSDEDRALLGANSKINLHEVELVVAVLKYLLQQGYSRSDFVILTPYLGQLVQIQQALRTVVEVDINEMDRKDLKKCDVDLQSSKIDNKDDDSSDDEGERSPSTVAKRMDAVRVSTIDNFQGEEANIVIGSLVRCNDENDIGFVSGAERVNVLLSRARNGMILIGSENTLRNARSAKGREVWNKVFRVLHDNDQVFNGFPAECCNHGTRPSEPLVDAVAFTKHVPDGGCCQPCGAVLPNCPNGHKCTRKCHPNGADVHLSVKCDQLVPALCPDGHPVNRVCSQEMPNKCIKRITYTCTQGHPGYRLCFKRQPITCGTCTKIEDEKKTLEEKQRKEEVRMNNEIETKLLENVKLEAELEDANRQRTNKMMLQQIAEEQRSMKQLLAQASAAMDPLPKRHKKSQAEIQSPAGGSTTVVPSVDNVQDTAPMENLQCANDVLMTPSFAPSTTFPTSSYMDPTELISRGSDTSSPRNTIMPGTNMIIASNSRDICLSNDGENSTSNQHNCDEDDATLDTDKLQLWLRLAAQEKWFELSDVLEEKQSSRVMKVLATSLDILVMDHLGGAEESSIQTLHEYYFGAMTSSWDYPIVHAVIYYVIFAVLHKTTLQKNTAILRGQEYLGLLHKCEGLPPVWEETVRKVVGCVKSSMLLPQVSSKLPGPKIESAAESWQRSKNEFLQVTCDSSSSSSNTVKPRTTPSEAMDDLMKMIGLESVKLEMLKEYLRINLAKEQEMIAGAASYNKRFDGNPGTGKTTVARLYGQFLIDVGILPPKSIVKETTGARLISEGVSGVKKQLEEIKEAAGGVVFVDEAYQLNPHQDQAGRQVLDFILTHAERLDGEYGKLVWIFAGYANNMDKLFEHNPGLPSRFPTKFVFEDYSDEELLQILMSLLERGGNDAPKLPKPSVAKPVPQPKKKTSKLSQQSFMYSGYSGIPQPDAVDNWGNIWTWDDSWYTYRDPYGNVNGYGPKGLNSHMPAGPLASPGNPIVDTEGNEWRYNASDKLWSSSDGKKQNHYPGSPKPQAAIKKSAASFKVSDLKWARIAIRRLGRRRGSVGFGNARAVRVLFDTSLKRQAERIALQKARGEKPDIFELCRDDLLGPKATREALESSKAWKKLLVMEGLAEVKEAIRQLIDVVIQNADKEEAERPLDLVMLNKTFVGNPGTGKTTVAKLYGEILCDLGMLSKGEFILKCPSDFIGSVLGSSESQTRAILNQAMGCVLVIDEAYLLNPSTGSAGSTGSDPFKSSVLDTIVEQVQARPGDDRAVLLLGYRKEMDELKNAANPGLSRRFDMENPIEFKDYDDAALVRILREEAKENQVNLPMKCAIYAIKQLAKERAGPHFGNAGAVKNLFSSARMQMRRRLSSVPQAGSDNTMINEDFSRGEIKVSGGEADIFADLVGCENILEKLKEYQDTILCAKKRGQDPKEVVEFNFLFVGSPGTGKTTVARRMGKLFHSLGLLPTDDVVEQSASSLITGFAGQAGRATNDVMQKARAKVLFIDEAYQLNPANGGAFMQEVVDEMVKCLTSKELHNQIVVILAGYESDIDEMLRTNQGLKSRFSEKLHFHDFSVAAMHKMLLKQLDNRGLKVTDEVSAQLPSLLKQLRDAPNFGNGRDVHTLSKRIFQKYATRTPSHSGSPPVSIEDCSNALKSFLHSKMESTATVKPVQAVPPQQFMSQFASPPKQTNTKVAAKQQQAAAPAERENSDPVDSGNQFLALLQTLLDERGLNSKEGVHHLSTLSIDSDELNALGNELASRLGITLEEAKAMISKWQCDQASVRAKMEEQEKEMELAKQQKRKARVPIWRCGVCGRANKPYIACFVQPFIVRYDEVEV